MPLLDVYGRTHELDTKSLDSIATRLEARRDSTRYMGMLHDISMPLILPALKAF